MHARVNTEESGAAARWVSSFETAKRRAGHRMTGCSTCRHHCRHRLNPRRYDCRGKDDERMDVFANYRAFRSAGGVQVGRHPLIPCFCEGLHSVGKYVLPEICRPSCEFLPMRSFPQKKPLSRGAAPLWSPLALMLCCCPLCEAPNRYRLP